MTVQGWFDYKDKVKRYFRFSAEEIRNIVIVTLVFAFIMSFRDWGIDKIDPAFGSRSFLLTAIVVGVGVIVHESMHKLAALYMGFRYEGRLWLYGLFFGLVLAFVTRGHLFLLFSTGPFFYHMAVHRTGLFRYGLNYWDQAKTIYPAILSNVILAGMFKIISVGSIIIPSGTAAPSYVISQAIRFNLYYAIFNMMPIPPMDGATCFFTSRGWYVFFFGCILIYAVLVLTLGIYSMFATLLGGIVLAVLFFFMFEREALPY
ncbi:hypothetical protein J4460_00850 [Candidatus Woesearchaeota archaeon]|nr:MAG: hypothetical protein QS99_C0002G0015 [archaeon GW2011_AR4]MBS3129199.1 hypothetical protein [Candidatus Woesearchaeota archaeon]HIH39042.1 hypothetical protein [Candidatus Woesearchaeota archaeon]HIH48349.1 hypothetical protein [Candidatus Woesearchaeota archaeon]HIJ04059.1 hypothetical protein [Candidatus Woesearchaeota archaeon]